MNDLDRMRRVYAERAQTVQPGRYSRFNPAFLFEMQRRERAVLDLLRPRYPLSRQHILEIGCGDGRVLLEFLSFGARHVTGIDIIEQRVRLARSLLPRIPLLCADGQHLPYASASFDIVLQYTALSSVLDDTVKARVAAEMRRVVRPDGLILWYDFWLNPTNPDARGISLAEVRRLFPGCTFTTRRITLAPPVTRKLMPISAFLCYVLEGLKIFNTHYLIAIRPGAPS